MLHTLQWLIVHSPAVHINLLCACWYSRAVKGSSSWSFCCLFISLRLTSYLLLSSKRTDAPHSDSGACPPPHPLSRWRLHSQGPHNFPSQGTRQKPKVKNHAENCFFKNSANKLGCPRLGVFLLSNHSSVKGQATVASFGSAELTWFFNKVELT
jgi:hypothetical protein